MTLVQITDVFFWCSRLHGKLWGLPEDKVRSAIYKVMATYKILVFVFSIIPYIALRIIA